MTSVSDYLPNAQRNTDDTTATINVTELLVGLTWRWDIGALQTAQNTATHRLTPRPTRRIPSFRSEPETDATNTVIPVGTPETDATNTVIPVGTPKTDATNTVIPVGTPETDATNTVILVGTPETDETNTVIPVGTIWQRIKGSGLYCIKTCRHWPP